MTTYWRGQELPPKRPGHVYIIRMWPGGRKVLDRCWFHQAHYADDAARRLKSGQTANVWLDDAALVLSLLPEDHPLRKVQPWPHSTGPSTPAKKCPSNVTPSPPGPYRNSAGSVPPAVATGGPTAGWRAVAGVCGRCVLSSNYLRFVAGGVQPESYGGEQPVSRSDRPESSFAPGRARATPAFLLGGRTPADSPAGCEQRPAGLRGDRE